MGLLDVYFVLGEHSPLASIIPSSSSADLRLLPYVQAIYAPLSESSRVIKASELSRALSGPAFLGDDFLDPTSGISIVVSRHLGLDGVTPMAEVFRYVLPDGVCVLPAVFLSSTSELTVVSLLNSQWIDLAHQTIQPGALRQGLRVVSGDGRDEGEDSRFRSLPSKCNQAGQPLSLLSRFSPTITDALYYLFGLQHTCESLQDSRLLSTRQD